MMKNLKFSMLVLALTLLAPTFGYSQSQANAIDKYFQQYVDNGDFTVVYISGKMFEMLGDLNIDKETLNMEDEEDMEAIMDIAQQMKGLRILTTDVDSQKYYKEAKSKIKTSEYEVLMTVRTQEGDNIEFLVLESEDSKKVNELLLLVGGDDFVLLSFVGDLDMEKVMKLANEIDKN